MNVLRKRKSDNMKGEKKIGNIKEKKYLSDFVKMSSCHPFSHRQLIAKFCIGHR